MHIFMLLFMYLFIYEDMYICKNFISRFSCYLGDMCHSVKCGFMHCYILNIFLNLLYSAYSLRVLTLNLTTVLIFLRSFEILLCIFCVYSM